ncbi:hypothetical protein [Actinocrispum wychmicini]|uniref:Polysaccharide lyase-like protein n=1 Tax=Actinocrispum wychmicini TaxID=1213861 RepID=A0A4R2JI33_9PSEU|nr:hypothetical protein [Actinocrispum wychmicini]TCO58042.1 hypothetical protein EV192_105105 [Actinocrispum wychmicini]
MPEPLHPRAFSRRTALRSLAVTAIAAPAMLSPLHQAVAAAPLWHPDPATDGLKAFEGIEADRGNHHPDRKYVIVEGDHYRFNIWADDRDTTGGGDRQRTESKGMVQNGTTLKMHNGETWKIAYEMFMPSTLHGTSRFTHIFQTKTPSTNGGPWVTLDLTRSGSKEMLRARAYANSGSPDIAATDLAPLRDKWITIEWTFTPGSKGTAACVIRNGTGSSAPIVAQGKMSNVNIPDQGDYVRPKWGIYRSVESAKSDIINTYLLFRNYSAARG